MRNIENNTPYPVEDVIISDYGMEISWNATKNVKELRRKEYVEALHGRVFQKGSRREAEIRSDRLDLTYWDDVRIKVNWVLNDDYYEMYRDKDNVIIRNSRIDIDL